MKGEAKKETGAEGREQERRKAKALDSQSCPALSLLPTKMLLQVQ